MPPLADREQFEAGFIADMEPVFQAQYDRAVDSPSNVPFAEFEGDLQRVMAANLAQVFKAAGMGMVSQLGIMLTAGLFDADAQRWAAGYSSDLANQVVDTSRDMAAAAVKKSDGDPEKLREGLALVFLSAARLKNIAVTEVTTGTSMGEHAIVIPYNAGISAGAVARNSASSQSDEDEQETERLRKELTGEDEESEAAIAAKSAGRATAASAIHRMYDPEGRLLIAIWRTSRRLNVCSHCAPLEGHSEEFWRLYFPNGSPAHPGCNCHLEYVEAAEWARRAA